MRFKLKIIYYWLKLAIAPKLNSRAVIDRFQKRKLKSFAQQTLSKSVFYSKYFVGEHYDWDAVPMITKTEFMGSFDEINTVGIHKEEALQTALEAEESRDFKSEINGITVGLSTGTSGKRGVFLVSEDERAQWVAVVMTRVIKPIFFKKQKVAFFLRANSNLYEAVASSLFEFRYFDIFKPLDTLLEALETYAPDILASQPSVLLDICSAQQSNRITIAPRQIISFAEVLHEDDRRRIEQIFTIKIKEVYQCTEGFLGVSCDHGTMHLNEDYIRFEKEWIDKDKFHPIITDFSRDSQPVVKYRLNDILQLKKTKCSCGSSHIAIEKILGRDDDVLLFDDKRIYPDLIARRIAQHTDHFTKYTIVQRTSNQLEIGIECSNLDFEAVKLSFTSALDMLMTTYKIDDIEYIFKNTIDHTPGHKLRKIKRLNYED